MAARKTTARRRPRKAAVRKARGRSRPKARKAAARRRQARARVASRTRKPARSKTAASTRKPRTQARKRGSTKLRSKARTSSNATTTARKKAQGRKNRPAPVALLERARRTLPDDERLAERLDAKPEVPEPPENDDAILRSARSGLAEMREELAQHTAASPKLTAGDVDARWQDAYAIGDEAPGGDNPTPDQDQVEDIGRALGVTYREGQELAGGEELTNRDRHRWEYDPASSDDWPHDR